MMIASNEAQVQAMLLPILQEALNNTMKQMAEVLRNIIDANVYNSYVGEWFDYRTYQFRDSWDNTKAEIIGNIIESTIEQDISAMKQFMSGWNNDVEVHEDREQLAEIIESGDGYTLGQDIVPPRPFWDDFKQYLSATLDATFLNECRKLGLDIL